MCEKKNFHLKVSIIHYDILERNFSLFKQRENNNNDNY